AQGVALGDRVLSLNRFQPTRENLWQILHLYRFVRPQAQQRVVIRKPDGSERALDIRSAITTKRLTELSDLIAEIEETIRQGRDTEATLGDTVVVWKMTGFGTREAVQQAIKRASKYKGLVIDLRDNGGGSVEALSELVSRTFDREIHVFTEKRRKEERAERARPKDAFGGTLVAVVDSRTASAAEVFARIVQLEKRGTVIGDRTAGRVMLAQFFPHAVGLAAVAFYATSITVADVRMSDGQSLENVGVAPDELAPPTGADLAAGRDPTLARAVALAGGTITAEAAGKLFRRER